MAEPTQAGLAAVLRDVVADFQRSSGADIVSVFLYDEAGRRYFAPFAAGQPDESLSAGLADMVVVADVGDCLFAAADLTIYRDTDSALFANPPEILMLIKWRELYGWLEETVDACKDVAQVIVEIVIKGS